MHLPKSPALFVADTTSSSALALRQLLEVTINSFPVACFVVDANRKVVFWNKACEILTGVPAESIIGTARQGVVFYRSERYVMADIVVLGASGSMVDDLYAGKYRPSAVIPGTFEAEDFFPHFGESGRWLYFTAAPLFNSKGELIGAIETLQDITRQRNVELALKASEERFKNLSVIDDLTKLFNTRHFHAVLEEELARANRYGTPLSLVIFDVDFFKQVNDQFGHQEGDNVLRSIAEELGTWKRSADFAFRFGGDEFAVILPNTPLDDATVAATRLADRWRQLPESGGARYSMGCTLSMGVVEYCIGESAQSFIGRADMAAYDAKRQGRNRVVKKRQ